MSSSPAESWRGKRVSDMTDDEIRAMVAAASEVPDDDLDKLIRQVRSGVITKLDAATDFDAVIAGIVRTPRPDVPSAAAQVRREVREDPARHDVYPITKDYVLSELRRYRDLYPTVPPDVAAFALIRRVDSWEEVTAIQAALAAFLKAHERA